MKSDNDWQSIADCPLAIADWALPTAINFHAFSVKIIADWRLAIEDCGLEWWEVLTISINLESGVG